MVGNTGVLTSNSSQKGTLLQSYDSHATLLLQVLGELKSLNYQTRSLIELRPVAEEHLQKYGRRSPTMRFPEAKALASRVPKAT